MIVSKFKYLIILASLIATCITQNIYANNDIKATSSQAVAENENNKAQETSKKININTADFNQLQQLNGVGAAKAQSIIDFRTQNGKFNNINEILAVPGIGKSIIEKNQSIIIIE